ncbi:unnamed protein product [Arctia plantaginis]|uniref:Protein-lysine N-methyltransferase SMYD4 n=1 Tax=Arctia plantaginis TaxID=874455 RepID=A0A8S0Z0Q9_ARCPL|nr:unnamed protein product [Arctia plantaginis]
MNKITLPEDCAKQWEILLLLISSEEKKIDRTSDTEIDTMGYFLKNEGVSRILAQWLQQMQLTYARQTIDTDTPLKCDNVSLIWRQRGNEKFRSNLFEDSYRCYTRSVMYANQGGPMYPLALANRSAALLKLKRFEECMADVTLAIAQGYPLEQQHKLLLRRADCHIELGSISKAKEAIAAATKHASTLSLPAAHFSEFEKNIKILQQKLEVLKDVPQIREDILPDCFKGLNENFNAASNVLKLRRSEVAGRHVIVKEATRRGDVMFSEEPYAWVTLPNEEAVCDGCCRGQINIVPCSECSRSGYCSEECRARAADSYHQWECAGARAELFPTIGIAHLALRVLLVGAHEGFPKVPQKGANPTTASALFACYSDIDDIEIYKQGTPPFYRMFNLVTNFDKMNNTDYIQYALTATLLTLYLENFTSFFEYLPSRVPYPLSASELRLFASAIILRSMGQLVCNGHATLSLCTVEEGNSRTLTEREVRRATAIYPSAAMMNHSCDPNIINTFHNNRLIVRCSRELSEGAELLNCYGPHRAREPTQHRRTQLRAQYMFTCNCDACTDTERVDFVLLFTAYACQSCKGPVLRTGRKAHCQQCQADFHLQRALATIDRADEMLAEAERAVTVDERCEKAHASFRLKQQVWHRHHASLRAAADHLARLYADVGEFNKSVELIKHNIQTLEYQFGSFSVEVAHELRKLSDVMLERIMRSAHNPDYGDWCLETHKILKKAVQLMELNYGSWEGLVKRLREQEAFVAAMVADSHSLDYSDNVHRNLHYNLKI